MIAARVRKIVLDLPGCLGARGSASGADLHAGPRDNNCRRAEKSLCLWSHTGNAEILRRYAVGAGSDKEKIVGISSDRADELINCARGKDVGFAQYQVVISG